MSARSRRLAVVLAGLVLLLFAGRWTAGFLADRWWAAELSPAAAAFLTQWHVLRLILKVAGVLVASAWFIGHLLVVYRAVGSVQIRRHVANLEIREALTPGVLLTAVVGGGVALGLLVGGGVTHWWRDAALAWRGVTYGLADPLLGRDVGLYVAQLPLWRDAHGFFLLLVLLALGVVFGLYLLVGAIRWMEGRPAINDHARRHLGWLLAGLGLALAWGYLLEPYETVAGLADGPTPAGWGVRSFVAPLLAGLALATAILSAAWAVRPRHALVAAGWIVLVAASVIGHWLLPSMLSDEPAPGADARAVERFTRMAYGLDSLRETRARLTAPAAPPALPALWNAAMISRVVPGDSGAFFWTDPAVIATPGGPRPAWLTVRTAGAGRVVVSAVAADRTTPDGLPLFYRLHDSLPRPSAAVLLELAADVHRPDAPSYRLVEGSGVAADSWLRRVVLAWALQAGALLGDMPPATRVDWHLSPVTRLARLAPFAEWGTPVARLIDGNLVWLTDGYLASHAFPLSNRVRWRGRTVGSMRAAFLGTVDAETGATRIYLRPGADRLAEAWAGVARGVVEPASSVPEAVLRAAPYPVEWFRVQSQEFERRPWRAGILSGRPSPGARDELPSPETQWSPDTGGPLRVAVYEIVGERRVSALLLGGRRDGRDALHLVRLDSVAALPTRGVLESRWSRFPSYDLITDSVRDEGARLERGPVRYDVGSGGPVAYQPYYAARPPAPAAVVWVSVAAPGDRLGAGRSLQEAWSNLLGATVPALPGTPRLERLDEARRWLLRADSAVRSGDWTAFGRAWSALRRALGVQADTAAR